MKIDVVGLVLIIGAIQGLALAFTIFQKSNKLYANKFLWILMLTFSVMLLDLWLSDLGFYQSHSKLMFTLEGIQLVIFPLYFLYSKYLTDKLTKFDKLDLIHFLPFFLYKLYLLPFYFMNFQEISWFQNYITLSNYPLQYVIFNWVLILQGYFYLTFTVIKANKRETFINEHFSSNVHIKLDWLKNASYLGILTNLVFTIENILLLTSSSVSDSFGISSITAGIYIYAMGYLGFSKSVVFTEFDVIEKIEIEKENITNEKYLKSGLSKENADKYFQKLIYLMEIEKIYKQNKLTLGDLADMITISSHNLSEVINTKTGMNFFDFINKYRIDEVKKEIIKHENDNLTLLAIALDSGFNSKSSFNTLFKKYENVTPTQFKKLHQIKS